MYEIQDIEMLARLLAEAGIERLELTTPTQGLKLVVHQARGATLSAPTDTVSPEEGVISAEGTGRLRLGHFGPLGKPISFGDPVREGQIIAVLEVGEINIPIVAQNSGTAGKWLAQEGSMIDFGAHVLSLLPNTKS